MRKTVVVGWLVLACCIGLTPVAFGADDAADEARLVPAAQDEAAMKEDAGNPDVDESEKRMSAELVRLTPKEQAAKWAERLAGLERQKDYAGLRSSAAAFTRWLEKIKPNEDGVYKNHIAESYKFNAAGLCGQGYYMIAANTIRNGYQAAKEANVAVDGLFEIANRYDAQKVTRDAYYKAIRTHQNAMAKIENALLDLATQKQKMVDELLQSKQQITPEALKALQTRIRELNARIATHRGEMAKETSAHKKLLEDKKYDGIILNPQLTAIVEAADKARQKTESRIGEIEKAVKKGLVALADKAEHSWKGLKERMNELSRLRKEIAGQQKELLALLAKKPYSEDAKNSIRKINALLEKLSAEFAKNLDGIEDDFMSAGTFNALDPKERAAFKDQLSALMKEEDEIEQTNARIEKLIAAMEKQTGKLGDLNGDGKIDLKDLVKVLQNLGRKAGAVANADLDGDGRISISDFLFLRESIYGGRTVFPADEKYQHGDLNGDGRLDWADLLKLSQITQQAGKNGVKVSSPWLKQYDINGDQVINLEDFQALVKNMMTPRTEVAPVDQTATPTVQASDTVPVTSPASAAVGTTVETGTSQQQNAQPAGTMGDN